jgi:hypothetical protein
MPCVLPHVTRDHAPNRGSAYSSLRNCAQNDNQNVELVHRLVKHFFAPVFTPSFRNRSAMKLLSYLAVCCSITRLGWACKCALPEFPNCEKEIGFNGEVLSYTVTQCPDSDGVNDYALVQIRVDELFKQPAGLGLQAGKIVTVRSPVQSATCGYFSSEAVGKRYLLTPGPASPPRCDALQTDTNLSIGSCDGNIEEPSEAQVRAYAAACGTPSKPSPGNSGPQESPPQVPDPAVDSTCLKECGAGCARCQRRCRGLRCNRRCGSRCASRCGAVCK